VSTGIVIGASGGIGAAAAAALDGAADRIVLAGRRADVLEAVGASLALSTAVPVAADVTTVAGRDGVVAAASGSISWVVLASGIPLRAPLAELDPDQIEMAFAANLVGPTLLLRELLDLRWDPPATLVIVGSVSATRALPGRAVYGATKAGIEHLGRSLAAELAPRGIRVNVVSPGVIDTPFLGDSGALDAWIRESVPAGRMGRVEEVAELIRYAALDAPDYLTGTRIAIDGGTEARA
jgi:NAD(P)-dependent dehydrogenase (short-subunit alcohol dehydrogenase family)